MRLSARYIIAVIVLCVCGVAFFYFLNQHNRRAIETRTVELAVSEGETIEKVLKQAAGQLLASGEKPLIRFLDEIFADRQVVYVALRRSGRLLHAASKFEGYLPLAGESIPVRAFSSPLGEILEVSTVMRDVQGQEFSVHIGYFFSSMDEIRRTSQRSLLLLTLLQAAVILVLAVFLISFNRLMGRNEIEVQKEKEEKEKLREISLVTAGINHEIRNPLHSLYLSYQLLEPRLDPADAEAVSLGQSFKREIKRIQDIIERFSDLSRPLAVRKETLDLPRFLAEQQPYWEGLGNGLRVVIDLQPGLALVSDRGLLGQVLDNLVRNAAESGAKNVVMRLGGRRNSVEILVRDDGPGIPANHLGSIFDPFVSFKPRGSGIGLAMARRIVTQLGGRIEVTSVAGAGAEFTIVL